MGKFRYLQVGSHAPAEGLSFSGDGVRHGRAAADLAALLPLQLAANVGGNGDLLVEIFAEPEDAVVVTADGVDLARAVKEHHVVLAESHLSQTYPRNMKKLFYPCYKTKAFLKIALAGGRGVEPGTYVFDYHLSQKQCFRPPGY